jgi:hypothetical protein
MDKVVRAGRLLMKRYGVVVPEDILSAVAPASEPATKIRPSDVGELEKFCRTLVICVVNAPPL